MTTTEFYNEFLVHYDRVTNNDAPGLNAYEISVLLTEAQRRIVKSNYQGKSNILKKGFEQTEKRRKDLSELIMASISTTGASLTSLSSNQSGAHQDAYFFDLPTNFWLAIEESLLTDVPRCDITQPTSSASTSFVVEEQTPEEAEGPSERSVISGLDIVGDFVTTKNTYYTRITVLPKTHDEYNSNIDNPFVKPGDPNEDGRDAEAWRLDFSRESSTTAKRHEIVTSGDYDILQYYIRYIAKLTPIIVADLTGSYTIDGLNVQTECILDSEIHSEIVQEAVSIALETVKDPRWQSQKIESMNVE